jgi:hypothetical protein
VDCIELRCTRDLALRLGATMPETTAHHRQLRDQGDLPVCDPRQPWLATFWRVGADGAEDGGGAANASVQPIACGDGRGCLATSWTPPKAGCRQRLDRHRFRCTVRPDDDVE